MERLREHLRDSRRALQAVFHNRALRQLQLAWAGSIIGTWMLGVALVVYAYDQGGASAVGLLALIRWLPAALVSPFTAMLGDRYPRVPVMLASDLLRAIGLAAMAVCVYTDAPVGVVYVALTEGGPVGARAEGGIAPPSRVASQAGAPELESIGRTPASSRAAATSRS